MLGRLTSAISNLTTSAGPAPEASHHGPVRVQAYSALAKKLQDDGVPVSLADCNACDNPCETTSNSDPSSAPEGRGSVAELYDGLSGGKSYEEYVNEKYGDLGELPKGFDMDWETDLYDSSKGGKGRIVVISTGKSDWERDHVDEKDSLAHHLDNVISSAPTPKAASTKPSNHSTLPYIAPSAFPAPSEPLTSPIPVQPSLYSSSLISQSDDPSDQTVLVFPDWKVTLEIENTKQGAQGLYDAQLDGKLGRAGKKLSEVNAKEVESGLDRRRSWVLPYRAIVLLCSHKKRDKRCHIAAPLLRSALHTVLSKYDIAIDEDGSSLAYLSDQGPALEEVEGDALEREKEVGRRIEAIEGVHGGEGGQVGVFNINHLGGHRYAGVMIVLFPSGAYISYGRVTPQEIPRVVEDTVLGGKIVPGLLRNAVGVARPTNSGSSANDTGIGAETDSSNRVASGKASDRGFLSW
ncbi:hypothetical protein I316_00789 [Kwoniella heveanensis BCC8398]|uniref:Sucrase/ferredoxin-like family protein n=1 Tax=Kwoniella heveanensis BCC8398 TaxID=1296120 RepID=A0A1B9H320_9TREE|nr:hypothetical protein I316_00789 [Kwoniella heveanensis BCC8398]